MLKIYLVFAISCLGNTLFSQVDYTKCDGNININSNTWYDLSFKNTKGKDKSGISFYCNLPIRFNNFIYLHFIPPNEGLFSVNLKNQQDSLIMFVFEVPESQDCKAIKAKKALMVACELKNPEDTTEQKYRVTPKKNYYVVFYKKPESNPSLSVKIGYLAVDQNGKMLRDSLRLNMISDYAAPVYEIHVRNAITHEPIVAKIGLFASSAMDGTYRGSEVLLTNQRKVSASIQLSAEGYYPKEMEKHVIVATGQIDTFFLTPITHGSITKLEDIFFKAGLAIILDESMPRLRKLRDFMVLNEGISIEIQGHVNEGGNNSLSSKRLSKKRAKKIMEYLIESGVDAKRLSAIGLGNTLPVYPNPETDEQKEANRRVEIKIK